MTKTKRKSTKRSVATLGKWELQSGEQAVIESRSAHPKMRFPWRGYVVVGDSVHAMNWNNDGLSSDSSQFNLKEPWVDRPIVNWDTLPKWATWVAQDEDGWWWWYTAQPDLANENWVRSTIDIHSAGRIPVKYEPKWGNKNIPNSTCGAWRESLVRRPL